MKINTKSINALFSEARFNPSSDPVMRAVADTVNVSFHEDQAKILIMRAQQNRQTLTTDGDNQHHILLVQAIQHLAIACVLMEPEPQKAMKVTYNGPVQE